MCYSGHSSISLDYGFDFERSATKVLTFSEHEIGPSYNYTWILGEHFFFIASAFAGYVFGRNAEDSANKYHFNGFILMAYPTAGITLGHGWSLKAEFGEISYFHTRGKDAAHTQASIFTVGANGSTLSLGVSKGFKLNKPNK